MNDTSKATVRMAGMHVTNEKGEILLSLVPSNGRTLASGEANRAYHYVHKAVNSYNPERDKNAMLTLENLTPGGSEYVGDITRCVEFIKRRQSSQHERIVKLTKQLRVIEERDRLAWELAISLFNSARPCLCRACDHSITLARQLLKLYEKEVHNATTRIKSLSAS